MTVKVELVHSEYHGKILGKPLFFIGITVLHPYLLHNGTASWIVSVMRRRNVRKAVLLNPAYHRFAGFRNNPPMPEFRAKPIAEIMAFLHADIEVAYREIVLLQADGVCVALGILIYWSESFLIEFRCFLQVLHGILGQKAVGLLVAQDEEKSLHILRRESS